MTIAQVQQTPRRAATKSSVALCEADLGYGLPKGTTSCTSSPRALYRNRKMATTPRVPPPCTSSYVEKSPKPQKAMSAGKYQMPIFEGQTLVTREKEAKNTANARARAKQVAARELELRLLSTPPVYGSRKVFPEPVSNMSEILEIIPEEDELLQRELFRSRPGTAEYRPACLTVEVETQIWPQDLASGELFDFDMEIQPFLEVMVGATVTQSLNEVINEEEVEQMMIMHQRYIMIRRAEAAETQRMFVRFDRIETEKAVRIKEHSNALYMQEVMEQRVTAARFMQSYIADMLPSVLEGLKDFDFLFENIKADTNDNFMPWLINDVTIEMKAMVCSRDILTGIVKELIECRGSEYRKLFDVEEKHEHDVDMDEIDEHADVEETHYDILDEE